MQSLQTMSVSTAQNNPSPEPQRIASPSQSPQDIPASSQNPAQSSQCYSLDSASNATAKGGENCRPGKGRIPGFGVCSDNSLYFIDYEFEGRLCCGFFYADNLEEAEKRLATIKAAGYLGRGHYGENDGSGISANVEHYRD